MAPLRRELTLFDMTMIAIGSTIGSGIFFTPSLIARELVAPAWILAAWAVGGLIAVAGALTFAELGALMPRAGGVYVFLCEAYGTFAGFLYGWAYFLVVNTGGIAALAVAYATYVGYFVPLSPSEVTAVAIAGIAIVTAVNVVGVKAGGIFSDLFTGLKLVGILGLIAVGLGWGNSGVTDFSASLGDRASPRGGALAAAMVGVLWSYGGWQHATFAAGEARDPERSVPLAMTLGALIVTAIYLLTNVAYLFLLPPERIALSARPAAEAVEGILGPGGGGLIALTIIVSTFGTAGIYTLTAPRIYYAMARDGVFLPKVAEIHPRFGTPTRAILLQSLWAGVLILFWGTFENLISYVVFTDWIFFALAAGTLFVIRRRQRGSLSRYRTPGYPVTPLVFIAFSVWFVVSTLVERPEQAWAGLGLLALGAAVYRVHRGLRSARGRAPGGGGGAGGRRSGGPGR